MKFERAFTLPGYDPFDSFKWVKRSSCVLMENGDEVNFLEVTVPEAWSQTAVDILAQKYLRKSGVPSKTVPVVKDYKPVAWLSPSIAATNCTFGAETDARQVFHRMVGAWCYHGFNRGVFGNGPESALSVKAFYDEIVFMLCAQMAAPASPQWFNTGLNWAYGIKGGESRQWSISRDGDVDEEFTAYKRPQVHACFPYDQRVHTDVGLIPIGDIVLRVKSGEDIHSYDRNGDKTRILAGVCNGKRSVMEFDFRDGSRLSMTGSHVVFVNVSGVLTERLASDLVSGDKMVFPRTVTGSATNQMKLSGFVVTEDLSWAAGVMVGDGFCGRTATMTSDTWEVKLNTKSELQVMESLLLTWEVPFSSSVFSWGWSVRGYGEAGKRFWSRLGLWGHTNHKVIPEWVFQSDVSIQGSFLRGLFDSDGHCRSTNLCLVNTSKDVIDGARLLMAGLGIHSSLSSVQDERDGCIRKECYCLTVADFESLKRFSEFVNFLHDVKRQSLCSLLERSVRECRGNLIEYVGRSKGGAELVYDIQTESGEFWIEGKLVHNCFIQSVSDSLLGEHGITSLVESEARVFKYGGGSGSNFSSLRGAGEKLSGGGRSSGLMSWLRILDRSAGAIKSGGTTRRAAKMVVLDLDHPDIEEFIGWKEREENKVASLVAGSLLLKKHAKEILDVAASCAYVGCHRSGVPSKVEAAVVSARRAGVPAVFLAKVLAAAREGLKSVDLPELDTSYEGEAYGTVSGQNANNSVSVTHEQMESMVRGGDVDLKGRVSDEFSRTVSGKELFGRIVDAAWLSADPGLQFSTTINDWNTCKEDGKIKASNPCVTGDTLVATSLGLRRIDSLLDSSFSVLGSGGGFHDVDPAFRTGIKPVYLLRTKAGYELKLTSDHRVLTVNRGDVPACELTRDDRVILSRVALGVEKLDSRLGEYLGLMVGDGCLMGSQEMAMVTLAPEEAAVAAYVQNRLHAYKVEHAADGRGARYSGVHHPQQTLRIGTGSRCVVDKLKRFAVLNQGSAAKKFTDEIYALDRDSLAAVLRGLFTADGTVANYGVKSQYVGLDSCSLELLKQVQVLLLGFGIKSKLYANRRASDQLVTMLPDGKGGSREYGIQPWHSLRVSRSSRLAFELEIGFLASSGKAEKLTELNRTVSAYADRLQDRVASLEYLGLEPVYDLTEPETHHFVANGVVIHNCGEYLFLDDTGCNLASLNLVKFLSSTSSGWTFEVKRFTHACALWATVLDITVGMASYPTKSIAEGSAKYRTIGLGYCNVGAMLMRMGIPYDSEDGRGWIAAVTALMHFSVGVQSSLLASELGAFPRYEENASSFLGVVLNHYAAVFSTGFKGLAVLPKTFRSYPVKDYLVEAVHFFAEQCVDLLRKHGCRNAQWTLLAPTGTIGLLMDCDTTGIEPDFSLVKFKKLAGGGYMKLVNQSVRDALKSLGYSQEQIHDIVIYLVGDPEMKSPPFDFFNRLVGIGYSVDDLVKLKSMLPSCIDVRLLVSKEDRGKAGLTQEQLEKINLALCGAMTVEGAPHLSKDHYAVFDCANKCGSRGERSLSWKAHLSAMAAAQPYLSGGISKTVNLPSDASRDDVRSVFEESWWLGLKDVAVFRDGSKLSQPLMSGYEEESELPAARMAERVIYRYIAKRRKLPSRRKGYTQKVRLGGHGLFLRTGEYQDGTVGEIFIDLSKTGATLRSWANCFAIAVSLGLQHGVPLDEFVDAFTGVRFEPSGLVTGHDDIKSCTSVIDLIFRELALTYLDRDEFRQIEEGMVDSSSSVSAADEVAVAAQVAKLKGYEGEPCHVCGMFTLVRKGACLGCDSCGSTSGCG